MHTLSLIRRISALTKIRGPRSQRPPTFLSRWLPAAAASVLTLAVSAHAQSTTEAEALDFDSLGSGFNYTQGTYSLGWRFTANQDITVTALGFYDSLKDGLTEAHPVGIFDADTQQLLVTATVQPSDPLTGFFRYVEVPRVVLPGGKDYYVAAVTGTEDYAVDPTTLNLDPSITFRGFAAYGGTYGPNTSTLQCPSVYEDNTYHGDFGPSFKLLSTTDTVPDGNPAALTFKKVTASTTGNLDIGWEFTPTKDIKIATIGYYAGDSGTFSQSHAVAVWDVATRSAVVPDVLVTNDDPLRGGFRYHQISPTSLTAGRAYFIMGISGSDPYATQVKKINVNPLISYGGAFFSTNANLGPAFPDNNAGGNGFFGPSFETVATTGQYVIASLGKNPISRTAGEKGMITLTRSGTTDLTKDVVVSYVIGGTLVPGQDYMALSGTKTIKAGQQSAVLKIKPLAGGAAGNVTITIQPTADYDPSTPAKIILTIIN